MTAREELHALSNEIGREFAVFDALFDELAGELETLHALTAIAAGIPANDNAPEGSADREDGQ